MNLEAIIEELRGEATKLDDVIQMLERVSDRKVRPPERPIRNRKTMSLELAQTISCSNEALLGNKAESIKLSGFNDALVKLRRQTLSDGRSGRTTHVLLKRAAP